MRIAINLAFQGVPLLDLHCDVSGDKIELLAPAPPADAQLTSPFTSDENELPVDEKPRARRAAGKKREISAQTGNRPAPTQDGIPWYLSAGDFTRTEILRGVSQTLGCSLDAASTAFEKVKQKKLIEKYDDEANGGLPKWRLVRQ